MLKFNKKSLLFLALALLFLMTSAKAASIQNPVEAFRQYKDIKDLGILVPTVVEVPIEFFYLERTDFLLIDQNTDIALPYFYKKNIVSNEPYYTLNTIPASASTYKMIDKNSNTYADFELDSNDQGTVIINLKSNIPITSSAIMVILDNNVAMPTSVEISAVVNGQNKKLLAKTSMSQQTIRFPETMAQDWKIVFTYVQPLRINEIRIVQKEANESTSQFVRFLAQPDRDYRLYFDSDRSIFSNTGEAGNLYSNDGVLSLETIPSLTNPLYTQADIDGDGLPDIFDNCVSIANKDQKDINGNGRGDACEDFDRDGISNDKDNCPNDPNRNQADIDRDGLGDLCDTEESRLTEKHKWIPWLGIVFALVVIVVLFVVTAKSKEPAEIDKDIDDERLE